MKTKQTLAARFFYAVTAMPKTIMTLAFIIIMATAAFIPTLTIDSRSEAFLYRKMIPHCYIGIR